MVKQHFTATDFFFMTNMIYDNAHIHANPGDFMRAVAKAREHFAHYPGFRSAGYGVKSVGNKFTEELSIILQVEKKKNKDEIPEAELLPEYFEGFKVDVHEIRRSVEFVCNNTNEYSVIQGGIQIGPESKKIPKISTGTLGCIVRKRGDTDRKNVYLLTCKHVLSETGAGTNDNVYHPFPPLPGKYKPLGASNTLGPIIGPMLKQNISYKDPVHNLTQDIYMDCAIARIDIDSDCCCCTCTKNTTKTSFTITDLNLNGKNTLSDVVNFVNDVSIINKKVYKVGARTGRTVGIVKHVLDSDITQPDNSILKAKNVMEIIFDITDSENPPDKKNCIGRASFAEKGDSGSIVVDGQNRVIGLLTSGPSEDWPANAPPESLPSLACFIVPVLDNLKICIPTSTGTGHGSCLATDGSGIPTPASPSSGAVLEMDQTAEKIIQRPFPDFNPEEIERITKLRNAFDAIPTAKEIHDAIDQFKREIAWLVNQSRPVTVAWQRNKGPAFLAGFVSHLRGESPEILQKNGKKTLINLLEQMNEVLQKNGSNQLRETLERLSPLVLRMATEGRTIEDYLHFIKTTNA
jgi:hypothetical protein